MRKSDILKIIEFLEREGLFTNSRTHDIVYNRYKNSGDANEVIQFILTSGEARGKMECSRCRVMKPANKFSFYQTRVSSDGYLMRSNALCEKCEKSSSKKRQKILSESEIPPKPRKGTACPNCGRLWKGKWHRHHSEKDGKEEFVDWICGNCNMAMQDHRNPETKYGR